MPKNNNKNYQVRTLGNSKYNYSREAEVIHGNAATGEQYSVKRVVYSEVPITPEIAKRHWDEMDKEVEQLQAQYPYQVISAVSYENEGGNQVIKFTPTTELIFPDRVPIYDENNKQIFGEENIRAEVRRREAQWAQWEREGKLEESVEIHHTDDGKTVRIRFRAAPRNESRSIAGRVYDGAREAYNKVGELLDRKGEPETKRNRTESENFSEDSSNIGVNRSENSASNHQQQSETERNNYSQEEIFGMVKVLDANLGKVSRENLIVLLERIKEELKKGEDYSQVYNSTSQDLRETSQKLEKFLNSSQTSVNSDINKNKISVSSVLILISLLAVLSVGSLVMIRRKFANKIKKN